MINRRSHSNGVNAHIGLEPTSASQSNNNFSNNIYVQTPYPAEVKAEPSVFTERIESRDSVVRDVLPQPETMHKQDVRTLILETYANILLNQDKTLIANLISKRTIIVPVNSLKSIIACIVGSCEVDIGYDEDCSCCAAKVSPIQKIDYIKVITESGEVITDFKQVYNKEYNELVNSYYLNLKYVVVE